VTAYDWDDLRGLSLARQFPDLDVSDPAAVTETVRRIGPIQSQTARSPYVGLGARLPGVTHDDVTDVGCTLRACRTEYLRRIPMFTGMHRFLPTLLKMAGARTTEIPVNHRPRLHGQPKYTIGNRLWRALADLFAVRWMQKRWIDRHLAEEIDVCHTKPGL